MVGLCLLAGVLVAGMLFPVAGGVGMVSNQASNTVNSVSANLVDGEVPLVTTITDRDGVPIAWVFDQNRVRAEPEDIGDTMKAAIIAIEDRRFFEHEGVDWRGTTRALMTNLSATGSAREGQGGTTLTMQYVKNYLLYVVAQTDAQRAAAVETTVARKLREIRVAVQLEQQMSKQEILAGYLNIVFFGNNAYGINSAARTYFDTTPDQLTVPQAALLAGMVRSPSAFDPVDNPEAAIDRRNLVIDQMVEVGSITGEQGRVAKAEPLGIQQPLTGLPNGCVGAGPAHGFFCQYALDYLAAAGLSKQELRKGGYTVRTTLDRRASDVAKQAADEQVPVEQTTGIANAVAIVEPGKDRHRVTALVANRDYGFDADAGQTAYPIPSMPVPLGAGSIYKIFTAAAALQKGLGIQTTIPVPSVYTSTEFRNGTDPYTVQNYSDTYASSMTLQQALAVSPNTAFVALEDRIGSVDPIVDMAYKLGMRTSLSLRDAEGRTIAEAVKEEERGSFTLGPEATSPLDLANVAATLMSGGTWCPPTPIESVTDRNGNPVPIEEAPCEQVVPEGLANTLAVGLSKDHTEGTATNAASTVGWDRPMIGKTGTTQNEKSAGFVGATPQYAAAVMTWSDATPPRPICLGDPPQLCSDGSIYGGSIPALTWFNAMKTLHEGLPMEPMPPTTQRYVTGGSESTVPNVIGMGENQARLELERAGFRVNTTSTDSALARGTVTSQSRTGAALPGDLVTIGISDGTPPPPPPETTEPPEPDTDQPEPTPTPGDIPDNPPPPPPPPPAPAPPPPPPDGDDDRDPPGDGGPGDGDPGNDDPGNDDPGDGDPGNGRTDTPPATE